MKINRFKPKFILSLLLFFILNLSILNAGELTTLFPQMDQLLKRVAAYNYGNDRTALATFDSVFNCTLDDAGMKSAIEITILEELQSDIETGAKAYYAEKLWMAGSKAAFPVLQNMLNEDATFDIALYALTGVPEKDANRVLIKSLTQFEGEKKIGIIQALGTRKDEKSLKKLYGLLKSEPSITKAAIRSIGQIGSFKSLRKLQKMSKKADSDLLISLQEAILLCAEDLKSIKKKDKVYQFIIKNAGKPSVKLAAVKSWVLLDPEKSEDRVLQILSKEDQDLYCDAISLLYDIPNADETTWKNQLLTLSASSQIVLLNVIASKGWQSILPEVLTLLDSENAQLRSEALSVIAQIGDTSCVLRVAQHAASGKDEKVAENTLALIPGKSVSESMKQNLMQSDEKVKIIFINALAARNVVSAVDRMKPLLKSDHRKIRTAASYAMGALASHQDIPQLIQNLLNHPSSAEKRILEKAIYTIAQRFDDCMITEKYVFPVFQSDINNDARQSLLELTGKLGESSGMTLLKEHLNHKDPDIQLAVIRGFSNWPNAQPVADLIAIAEKPKNKKFGIIAIRGAVRLMEQDNVTADSVKINYYKSMLSLEHQPTEIRLIISGLSKLQTMDAIDLIEPYYTTETYRSESEFAIMALIKSRWWKNRDKSMYYLKQLVISDNADIKKQAQKIIYEID